MQSAELKSRGRSLVPPAQQRVTAEIRARRALRVPGNSSHKRVARGSKSGYAVTAVSFSMRHAAHIRVRGGMQNGMEIGIVFRCSRVAAGKVIQKFFHGMSGLVLCTHCDACSNRHNHIFYHLKLQWLTVSHLQNDFRSMNDFAKK